MSILLTTNHPTTGCQLRTQYPQGTHLIGCPSPENFKHGWRNCLRAEQSLRTFSISLIRRSTLPNVHSMMVQATWSIICRSVWLHNGGGRESDSNSKQRLCLRLTSCCCSTPTSSCTLLITPHSAPTPSPRREGNIFHIHRPSSEL